MFLIKPVRNAKKKCFGGKIQVTKFMFLFVELSNLFQPKQIVYRKRDNLFLFISLG